jgi:hypothetical protein
MRKKKFEALKLFFTVCFAIIFAACDGQAKQPVNKQSLSIRIKNTKSGEKFDTETFHKHQQSGSYEFYLKDTHVRQFSYTEVT